MTDGIHPGEKLIQVVIANMTAGPRRCKIDIISGLLQA